MCAELLKAILIGICVAIPIGPVLVLVLEKTLSRGRWTGVVTGVGSALVDTMYATAGLFALSLVSGLIDRYQPWIMLAGGLLVVAVGCFMSLSKAETGKSVSKLKTRYTAVGYAFQAMGCALSNPGAIAVMFAALAFAGLDAVTVSAPVWGVLLCVFAGEMLYWTVLTGLVGRFVHVTREGVHKVSRVAGIVVAALGLVLIVRGIILLLR